MCFTPFYFNISTLSVPTPMGEIQWENKIHWYRLLHLLYFIYTQNVVCTKTVMSTKRPNVVNYANLKPAAVTLLLLIVTGVACVWCQALTQPTLVLQSLTTQSEMMRWFMIQEGSSETYRYMRS